MKRILVSILVGIVLSLGIYLINPIAHEYLTCGVIAATVSTISYFVFLQKSKNAFVKLLIIFLVSFFVARYFYFSVEINENAAICFNIIPFIIISYFFLGFFMKKR